MRTGWGRVLKRLAALAALPGMPSALPCALPSALPFALLPALLCAAPPAMAREWLVVGSHFERVYERAPDGSFTGIGAEIVQAVARQTNDTVRFELYPWARAQAMITQGKADILVGPYKSAARLSQMAFSQRAFYRDQMVFYARADAGIVWDGDYRALAERRIVLLNGWVYGQRFAAAMPALHTSMANSVESGLLMVAYQHVDLFVTNMRNTEPVLARLRLGGQLQPLPHVLEEQDGYFAFPQDATHDVLRARFDRAFNAMVERGELKRLGQRYAVTVP